MNASVDVGKSACHYFVDEAGDGNLFDKKGRVIIGKEGCSRFFILGFLEIAEPEALSKDLEGLRARLLADPYFKDVPSMQPEAKKTALSFHAKDDIPEVRREVFAALSQHDVKFLAAIRDKRKLLEYVRQRNDVDTAYHYNPNELYDYMARCLFGGRLHKHPEYRLFFSRRGKADRTAALREALDKSRQRFAEKRSIVTSAEVHIDAATPITCVALQAVDYFLWALQRLYEKHEDRYVQFLWPKFSLVRDLDDTRLASYGVYYTKKKPLISAALAESREI